MKDKLLEYGIDLENTIFYGKDKVKLKLEEKGLKQGKLILVTSINPTPYGEGKTTVSIGLHDALCKLGKKSIVALREPSLGPVFGRKGGATGGGESIVLPEDEINLHFTGDMHAIGVANNLISAAIDNHLYHGNKLQIDPETICFRRCLDMNDRALRDVTITIKKDLTRQEHFQITAASELMAILCLATSYQDLKNRIEDIYIGNDIFGKKIFVRDLNCSDAVCILLQEAIYPNAVLTKEGNLAFIHGGPFANIAHGCSSFLSIQMALNHADYVITEAGFGSDLGGFKFFDILARNQLVPDLVVLNVTVRALKYHGNGSLKEGISNLEFHLKNMNSFLNQVLVVLNQFDDDEKEDIIYIKEVVENMGYDFVITNNFKKGSEGALDFASKTLTLLEQEGKINFLYDLEDTLPIKIEKVLKHLGASNISYSEEILSKLKEYESIPYPVCIAKTPSSISDDPKLLGYPKNYSVTVKDLKLCNGAKFIVVYLGDILTLPGLGADANLYHMKWKKA